MSRHAAIVALCAATLATTLVGLVLRARPSTVALPDGYGVPGSIALFVLVLAGVGAAIAWRQPGNIVGWIFLASAAAGAVLELADDYSVIAIIERQAALPGGDWAAWVAGWMLAFFVGPISTYGILVFPDGRPPSARWRPVAWYTIAALALWAASAALVPGRLRGAGYASNPLWGPTATFPLDQTGLTPLSSLFVLPPVVLCAAGLVHRFRHARGVERQQLKWMAYAGAIVAIGVALLPATPDRKWLQVVQQATLLLIPAAAGIAILRYHLYDVDLLIKRTLVYGLLSAILTAVYAVAVVLSQPLLRPFTGGAEISVALSTLAVVVAFQPARRRVRELVDRRFYRARYDAARTLDAFSVRLRDEVDLDSVRTELVDAAATTMQPAHASVWLRR